MKRKEKKNDSEFLLWVCMRRIGLEWGDFSTQPSIHYGGLKKNPTHELDPCKLDKLLFLITTNIKQRIRTSLQIKCKFITK